MPRISQNLRECDIGTLKADMTKTATFVTPTCAIASKLPQLQLLTPMVNIKTVYLPELCPIACVARGWAKCTSYICWLCFGVMSPRKSATVAYLNDIVSWVGVWAGTAHGFRDNLIVIEGNLNAQRY